ncbi:MAG TPA: hypothetical protein VF813_11805, partial [Anaerolineaceae bacterium]
MFRPTRASRRPWVGKLWILGLFIGGIVLWGAFYEWGRFPLTFHDWAQVTTPRFLFLKDAILNGILPLHISGPSALGNVTDRYLSIPDAFLSPQALLLASLPVGGFVLVNQVLMYSLGFLGLLWFERKYRLSPFAFTILFLLYNFNGHVLSHFAVGHDTWGGYFLFPWFAMLVISMLEGERTWGWVAKTAVLLFVMILQGSFHQFVWCLIFLGLLALTTWKVFLPALAAAFFAVAISLFRLLPPSLLLNQFGKAYAYMGGYPTVGDLWQAMVNIRLPGVYTYPPYVQMILGSWEFDLYVGLLGVAFLLTFGVYFWWKNRADAGPLNSLVLPLLGVAILSIGDVYQIARVTHIPLLDGERVSTRMISLPFVFLLILAVREFQRWLDRVKVTNPIRVAEVALLFVGSADLWRNFNAWKLANTHLAFDYAPIFSDIWYAVVKPDAPYERILILGATGTMISLVVALYLAWMESRGAIHLARRAGPRAVPAGAPIRQPIPLTG